MRLCYRHIRGTAYLTISSGPPEFWVRIGSTICRIATQEMGAIMNAHRVVQVLTN